jgi:type III secretion protein C
MNCLSTTSRSGTARLASPIKPNSILSALSVTALCVLTSLWMNSAAYAGDIRWKPIKFSYVAKSKNLKEFLREFGLSQGLTVVVAKDVEGIVNGKFDLLPATFIELMAASFGFVWYSEGNVLYVSNANDVRSEVLRLANSDISRLQDALERLDLTSKRYPIIYDTRQGTVLVSGPNRYVDLVLQTAKSIDQPVVPASSQPVAIVAPPIIVDNMQVRVFPLKYAWANDFTYSQSGKDQTVLGVANVLSQLHNGPAGSKQAANRNTQPGGKVIVDALKSAGADVKNSAGMSVAQRLQFDDAPQDKMQAQFMADGRMNAIVVKDNMEKMSAHEATIRALDVKPGLIEIEVQIIDVNTEDVESLGVDWRAKTGRLDVQVGSSTMQPLTWASALTDNASQIVSKSPVGIVSTVLGDAGRFLMTRVNLLAQQGRANLLSSPKLMTLDNVEAMLDNTSTFFIKVKSERDAGLFNVSVGTTLRVTPLIVEDEGKRMVKLAIRIEDGGQTGQLVDDIPVIRRNTITTQSLIPDGQALLIAGYSQESEMNEKTNVPGFSNFPIFGNLFKSTTKKKVKAERFFLLTPKIVSL